MSPGHSRYCWWPVGADLTNCGPGEATFVKGKLKNQRKLVCIEEIMPREKQIGYRWEREGLVLDREAFFSFFFPFLNHWFLTKPLHIPLGCWLHMYSSTPTFPSTPFLRWFELISLPRWGSSHITVACDAFVSTQGSGDGGDPSLQYSFHSGLDLPHWVSPF